MSRKISCLIVDDEPIAREILTSYVAKVPQLELINTCANAMQAFEIINKNPIDLLFLDINMPEVTGLSLAKSINQTKTKIIFTTAYREYAIDGFDLRAVDYLLKPIAFDRFLKAVNAYFEISTIDTTATSKDVVDHSFIFVRADRKMIKINFSDILYIESLSDYIKIHTTESVIVTRETISNIETKIPSKDFIRVHRSYIIAISKISAYSTENIEIHNKTIPISRTYREYVLKTLKNL